MSKELRIYAIKDMKANEYNTPFFQPSDVHALRVFRTEINRANEQNLLYLYPEEFELHFMGIFVPDSGDLERATEHGPKVLSTGTAVKIRN